MDSSAGSKELRDLTSGEFEARYECDRFTSTILSSRFRYVLKHVCGHLLHSAFSPLLREYYDFSAAIAGPAELDYALPAVAQSLSVFFGSMQDATANAVREYGEKLFKPGDILVSNDPYRSGTHVNDVCFMRPVFYEGRIISFLTIRAHMMDMGGDVPGGFSGMERNVYENGLVLPPMLIFSDDEPVKSVISLLMDNVRFGSMILPDIQSIAAALRLGEELLLETVTRYGEGAYLGAMRYACDVSAEMMRQAISRLPDGDYAAEDFLDCDGIENDRSYRLAVLARKRGHRLEIDLSGSSEQARTAINAAWPDAKSAVVIALKFLLDPRSAFTSATLRDVDIVLPMGTAISATPPDGAVFTYWEPLGSVIQALMQALAVPLGADAVAGDSRPNQVHSANGLLPDGQPWVSVAVCGGMQGGWGATAHGDADSGQVGYVANLIDPPVESIEADSPVVVMRKEYLPDSGGAGKHRGGAGVVKDSYWPLSAHANCLSVHLRNVTGFGVNGGFDSGVGGTWFWEPSALSEFESAPFVPVDRTAYPSATPVAGVFDPKDNALAVDGEYRYWAAKADWATPANTVWRYVTPGGGGWGNPLDRDVAAVLNDVRDGYVSLAGAKEVYGVVIAGDPANDPEAITVDEHATAACRASMKDDDSYLRSGQRPTPDFPEVAPGISVHREPVSGRCVHCGSDGMARYPVLRLEGWFDVVKCQACLETAEVRPSHIVDGLPLASGIYMGNPL